MSKSKFIKAAIREICHNCTDAPIVMILVKHEYENGTRRTNIISRKVRSEKEWFELVKIYRDVKFYKAKNGKRALTYDFPKPPPQIDYSQWVLQVSRDGKNWVDFKEVMGNCQGYYFERLRAPDEKN